jgi:hypothetical protein
VAVTQMGGHGSFAEPRTGVSVTNGADDRVSDKLAALQAYQLSLLAPVAPQAALTPRRRRAASRSSTEPVSA